MKNEQRERLVRTIIGRGNRPLEVALLKLADALEPLDLEGQSRVLGGILAAHIGMHEPDDQPEAIIRVFEQFNSATDAINRHMKKAEEPTNETEANRD